MVVRAVSCIAGPVPRMHALPGLCFTNQVVLERMRLTRSRVPEFSCVRRTSNRSGGVACFIIATAVLICREVDGTRVLIVERRGLASLHLHSLTTSGSRQVSETIVLEAMAASVQVAKHGDETDST